jgi:membrane protein DedA with SNARE-associated domain
MSGTRAVISFFSGMSGLPLMKTLLFAGISSFLWYGILSTAGYYFGNDWKTLIQYLHIYDKIVIIVVSSCVVIATVIWFLGKRIKCFNKTK